MVLDEIGPWSLVKLDIVREYAQAYSRILSAQRKPGLHHVYKFFASHKPVAAEIVQDIFRKHGLARSPVPTGLGA